MCSSQTRDDRWIDGVLYLDTDPPQALEALSARDEQDIILWDGNKGRRMHISTGGKMTMDRRTVAIIVTVVAIVLCVCPGLFSLFMGGMFALVSFMPGADIDVFGSADPRSALSFGIGGLCIGAVLVLIAGVAILVAWRRKGEPAGQ